MLVIWNHNNCHRVALCIEAPSFGRKAHSFLHSIWQPRLQKEELADHQQCLLLYHGKSATYFWCCSTLLWRKYAFRVRVLSILASKLSFTYKYFSGWMWLSHAASRYGYRMSWAGRRMMDWLQAKCFGFSLMGIKESETAPATYKANASTNPSDIGQGRSLSHLAAIAGMHISRWLAWNQHLTSVAKIQMRSLRWGCSC